MLRNHYLIEHWTMADFGKNLTERRERLAAATVRYPQQDLSGAVQEGRCAAPRIRR